MDTTSSASSFSDDDDTGIATTTVCTCNGTTGLRIDQNIAGSHVGSQLCM
jgi:hypothetical protein